jgi:hypothetical protein
MPTLLNIHLDPHDRQEVLGAIALLTVLASLPAGASAPALASSPAVDPAPVVPPPAVEDKAPPAASSPAPAAAGSVDPGPAPRGLQYLEPEKLPRLPAEPDGPATSANLQKAIDQGKADAAATAGSVIVDGRVVGGAGAPETAPAPAAATVYPIEQVKSQVRAWIKAGKGTADQASRMVFEKFGVASLSALPEAKRREALDVFAL